MTELDGLPARICWLGYNARPTAGVLFNELVRDGKISAPRVIARDLLDSGSGQCTGGLASVENLTQVWPQGHGGGLQVVAQRGRQLLRLTTYRRRRSSTRSMSCARRGRVAPLRWIHQR